MAIPRDQRPFQELDWASTALKKAGFAFDSLTQSPDPPDCVAMFDSGRAGIEVTELVDAEARKRTEAKNYTYREWDQPSFLSRIQEIIDGKAAKPFQGGPYAHTLTMRSCPKSGTPAPRGGTASPSTGRRMVARSGLSGGPAR
jgi:hypothetical protein